MLDTTEIKDHTDLLALVGQTVELRKVSGTEYAGPCPRCGGTDRFHVDGAKGWWFCRQCYGFENGKPHDAIAYMQWRYGVSFKTACEMLGADPSSSSTGRIKPRRAKRPVIPTAEAPGSTWQEMAERFVTYAEERLWETPEALAYLVGRGLSHETIRAARLGWNSGKLSSKSRSAKRWGLDRDKPVWLPRGWTLPCWMGGELRYVKVRRPDRDLRAAARYNETHPGKHHSTDKYIAISGSKVGSVLYGLDDLSACEDLILCEGEYDALLLRQHLGGIAAVVATGAAQKVGGSYARRKMIGYRRHWTALDADAAGKVGVDRWTQVSARVRPLPPPDHDVTDAWRAGHDLIAWAVAGIGPDDPDKRKAWLRSALAQLGTSIVDPSDEHDPDLLRWLACYAQLADIEGWGIEVSKRPPVRDPALPEGIKVPFEGLKSCQNEDFAEPLGDRGEISANTIYYFEGWTETDPPIDLAPAYAWCADGHRWYSNPAGELMSVPTVGE